MLVIETQALSRSFRSLLAVDQLNLNVPQGSVYGFLGPNGAGKSTTIRLLLGLLRADSGRATIMGREAGPGRRQVLQGVGALVEAPSLYPHLTGRENLELTSRLIQAPAARTDQVLDMVRLQKDAGRPVKQYSLGMRQRLGLALALLPAPEVLILDEPTNGLDPAGIREMRELIRDMPGQLGLTVFLSSHLLNEVEQLASHVGILHQGRLLHEGTLEELQVATRRQLILGVDRPRVAVQLLAEQGWHATNGTPDQLVVDVEEEHAVARINQTLVNAGLQVHHLSLSRPSLEDIFLSLTDTGRQPS